MRLISSRSIIIATLVVGVGFWVISAKSLVGAGKFDFIPNIASIKGSPYGKVLAFAMQGPVDLYWHDGQTHADAEHMTDVEHVELDDVSVCTSGCDDHKPTCQVEVEFKKGELSWNVKAKDAIDEMAAYTRRITNGGRRTKEHLRFLQSVTEDKLKFAYELDPTNYINYNNFQLFLLASNLGRSAADSERAYDLSKATLELCRLNESDPSVWITAAAAAYDIVSFMGKNPDDFSKKDLELGLADMDDCLEVFVKLFETSQSLKVVSPARSHELEEYFRFISKLRESYGVYINNLPSNS